MSTKMTKNEFVNRSNLKHNYKYDYSKVEYNNSKTKICIICPIHGEFWQLPLYHLQGRNCQKCASNKINSSRSSNINSFIINSNLIHDNKYDYDKSEYINNHTKIIIKCKLHGEFNITPNAHLNGQGCPKCKGKHKTDCDFITESINTHGHIYDYSKVNYKRAKDKICIICLDHGEFWQSPNSHLNGRGCPKCKKSHIEREVTLFLNKLGIKYEEQKTFEWLKNKRNMYLDFYLPDYNIAIECQGRQHFEKHDFSGKNKDNKIKNLNTVQDRDFKKNNLCKSNNINIVYILDFKYINKKIIIYNDDNIFKNINELYLKLIKNGVSNFKV